MRRKISISIIVICVLTIGLFAVEGRPAEEIIPPVQPRFGGTLIVPLPFAGTVATLDPPHSTVIQDVITMRLIFDSLLDVDEETLKIIPSIAESWEVSEDGLVYTFHLRRGVKFHNLREVTAHDAKFSFERIMDPEEATLVTPLFIGVVGAAEFVAGEADHISGIVVVDNHTLQITLVDLDVGFLLNVASEGASILPKEEVEKWGDLFGTNPVGAGPFKFVHWIRGAEIVVEAFDEYWGGRPYLDRVVLRMMPEAAVRVAAFKVRELDFDIVFPAQYKVIRHDPEKILLMVTTPELWTRNITFHMDVPELRDVRVRKAFNYAIDRELIVEKLLGGMAHPATGWFPLGSPAFNPDLQGFEYNPERAAQLMKEAGWSVENPLRLTLAGTPHPAWGIPVVVAIMPMLARVGFEIIPVPLDFATFFGHGSRAYDMAIGSRGGVVSPLAYIRDSFWSQIPVEAGRFSNWINLEFDRYIELAMREPDFDKRIRLLQRAEEILVADPPVWFFNYNKGAGLRQPWVHGIVAAPRQMTFQPWHRVWIDERSPRA